MDSKTDAPAQIGFTDMSEAKDTYVHPPLHNVVDPQNAGYVRY